MPFILQSKAFFSTDVLAKLPDPGASVQQGSSGSLLADFLSHVEMRLVQATDMCASYLDPSTKAPLTMLIEDTMLRPHVSLLLSTGANALFENSIERMADLKRLYNLFDRIQAVSDIKLTWSTYIKSFVSHALSPPSVEGQVTASEKSAADLAVIDSLLGFHERMLEVLRAAFHNLEPFKLAMKSAFETSFGEHETSKRSRPAELLVKFIDKRLCGGEKKAGLTETEMENSLDRILELFRFLQVY